MCKCHWGNTPHQGKYVHAMRHDRANPQGSAPDDVPTRREARRATARTLAKAPRGHPDRAGPVRRRRTPS
eukprot:2022507-Alexandrium_andersonii.AAC.1